VTSKNKIILNFVCLFILIITVVAGLWPFNLPNQQPLYPSR
jgi:hypothetical protein